ncbi:DUF4982 domain-containing protein [candidate division KSB1 bacterium]|nr:DUF4982 domain-containing protein [candidate division KSB1 bacterium]
MKLGFRILITLLIVITTRCTVTPEKAIIANETERERLNMDFGWKFSLGHAADMTKDFDFWGGNPAGNAKTGDTAGPPHPDFDDSNWEVIDVPHDWCVGVGVDKSADPYHGYKKIGREWPGNSIGWYRKTFEIPADDLGRRLTIEFDGVFRDCEVWFNGHPLWHHQSGYTSFGIDVSDYVNYGEENVIVVRVDATGYELWSYEGAGIYRHVWLVKTKPLHVARWGTYVSSEVDLKKDNVSAKLTIETILENQKDESTAFKLISAIIDSDGKELATTMSKESIGGWDSKEVIQKVNVRNAKVWSLDSPNLYTMVTTVEQSGRIVDTYETTFGIRTFKFDPDKGFFLNGKPMKLKGVCLHQDHGGVGIAVPDRVKEFRVAKLKEMGCNSIRTAHNWVSTEMLDICDRLGMLVMDETRMSGSSKELLEQLESMVLRDRNHPSIIVWSLGNEEHVLQGSEVGARVFRTMKRLVRKLDQTRPVTLGMNDDWGSVVTEEMDIQGCNYLSCGDIEELRKNFPDKPILLSESASSLNTRGIYKGVEGSGHCTEYDETFPDWGTSVESMWKFVAERDWLAGTYVWTGFDYGGEPDPVFWPAVNSNFGIIDRGGFPKDNYYYFQSWWTDSIVFHLTPHWNWAGDEGKIKRIVCNTNCEEAELIVNGKSLGWKAVPRNSRVRWEVAYEPGFIEAKGYNEGKLVATDRRETTGKTAAIQLKPDRSKIIADNYDVSMVTLEIVDNRGRIVPGANNEISLSLSGNGKIIGVCNGDPSCKDLENQTTYPAFNGLMMIYVQSGLTVGPIVLKAEAKGLKKAEIVIEAEACCDSSGTKINLQTTTTPLLKTGNFDHIPGPNPALKCGENGAWDDRALESGDCFKDGDTYYWYYHAFNQSELKECNYKIGVATSNDPLGPWIKYSRNPILQSSDNSWEKRWVACPMVIKEGELYYMFYSSCDSDWRESICLATAENPLGPWKKFSGNPIIDNKNFGYIGGVVKYHDKFLLYATNPNEIQGDYGRVYLAFSDTPEGPWENHQKPVFSEGPEGSWDEGAFSEFEVLYYNNMFHAFYGACKINSDRTESIGYAYSKNGVHWTRFEGNPVASIDKVPNASAFAEVHAVIEYPKIYLYHTLRYFNCPEWYSEEWCGSDSEKVCLDIEDLGIQVLEIKK